MKKLLFIPALALFVLSCGRGNQASSADSTTSSPSQSTEAAYKLIIPINDLQPIQGASEEDMGEVASDNGFYLMTAEDALKAKGYQISEYCFVRDSVKIVDKDNKLVKYASVKAQMQDQCCGMVLAQTGKETKFVPLNADTDAMVKEVENYFK